MPLGRYYNEMYEDAADGVQHVRPHYRPFADWLAQTPPEKVAQNRQAADLLFHRVGITFAVYGESAGARAADPVRHHAARHPGRDMGRASRPDCSNA